MPLFGQKILLGDLGSYPLRYGAHAIAVGFSGKSRCQVQQRDPTSPLMANTAQCLGFRGYPKKTSDTGEFNTAGSR